MLGASAHLGFARVFDADLRRVGEIAFAGCGSPWEYQCSLPQWRTEQILAERLQELVVVERGVAAASLEADGDGVLVELQLPDGAIETIEARSVIGAGGAHSVTRASMAEDLAGATYPGTALVADVRVRCELPLDGSALVASPEGYVLLASGEQPLSAPAAGDRYPARTSLFGTSHHLLLAGVADDAGIARLRGRWRGLVDVIHADGADPHTSGAILVRPDGHIGFLAAKADAAGLSAIDAHLDSYLIPA